MNIQLFYNFVKNQHKDQFRKYTCEPYIIHCERVARLVEEHGYSDPVMYCTAIGHDLIEDTNTNPRTLLEILYNLGFNSESISSICTGIRWLTNSWSQDRSLNRKDRLQKYHQQLSSSPGWVQTIKYADIIDNCRNIREFDPKFADQYCNEKLELLSMIRNGDQKLFKIAMDICQGQ